MREVRKKVDRKIVGILVCTLLIAATVLPVAGMIKETKEEGDSNISGVSENGISDIVKSDGFKWKPARTEFDTSHIVPAYKKATLGVPDYEFVKTPTKIMTSYYDYMPGSYCTHPIRIQTENGDGHYLTFFARPTKRDNRRQYWAYYDKDGNIQDWNTITSYDTWQGYGGIGIHPTTGDCVVTWHEDEEGDGTFETALTYDNYYTTSAPGNWQTPVVFHSSAHNEYIWPYIEVGPSPLGEGYVRIYQLTTNAEPNSAGNPCEDVRLMYIDVENTATADLSSLLDKSNWNEVTIFTDWRAKSCRPFQSFAIDYNHPGKVAFIGYAVWLEGDQGDMPVDEGMFVWESYDYGETWDTANLHSDGPGAPIYYVENPGYFPDAPEQLEVTVTGWHGTALYDSDGNLHWTFLQTYGYSDESGSYYFPYYMPQAEAVWDGSSFTFREVPQLPGTDPLSGHTVPWDTENTYPVIGWSTYPAGIFHENTQKNAINLENHWIAQVWVDGTYHQLGEDGDPNYADYIDHPIICISISNDNGNTWFDPIMLTDVFSDKFDFSDQITVYPYICDQIIDLEDDWGLLYMYYFDDNKFGSAIQGGGFDPSGDITYCAVKIKFSANEPPTTPTITGKTKGKPNKEYSFTFKSTDPEGSDVYYWVDWGDGNNTGWDGPHPSGEEVTLSHTWSTQEAFTIKAKAKDTAGAESDWGEHPFSTPRNRAAFSILLEKYLIKVPFILRYLLNI